MFDEWVRDFIVRHPNGTVIELGAGLNARFERLDNERISWVDVDLPDVASLRSHYFPDNERHLTIGASVTETSWITRARTRPGPYFLVAEAVFVFLAESDVRQALSTIAAAFPEARLAFDTASQRMIDAQGSCGVMSGMAQMSWACDHPRVVEDWDLGVTLLESRTFFDAPAHFKRYEPFYLRWLAPLFFRRQIEAYRLNLFQVGREV
jgi:O-methyltransferase involved in polyketide biosynthesis